MSNCNKQPYGYSPAEVKNAGCLAFLIIFLTGLAVAAAMAKGIL